MAEQEGQQTTETEDGKLQDGAPSEGDPVGGQAPAATQAGDPGVETMFDIDGERVPMSIIKEWKSGHMKDADYRQKTSEIAENKRQYQKQMEQLNPYLQTIEYLNGRPDLLAQVNELIRESYAAQGHNQAPTAGNPNQIPTWAKGMQEKLEDIELERQIGKLKANPLFADKLKDGTSEQELLKFALDKNIGDLEVAASAFYYSKDVASAKMAGAQQVTDGLTKKKGIKPPVGNGSGMQTPPAFDPKKASMDQVFEQVGNDLFNKQ
jgi:hypothetical protein